MNVSSGDVSVRLVAPWDPSSTLEGSRTCVNSLKQLKNDRITMNTLLNSWDARCTKPLDSTLTPVSKTALHRRNTYYRDYTLLQEA